MNRSSFILVLFVTLFSCAFADGPHLLIKIATRGQAEQLFATLDAYYKRLSHAVDYTFLISCDVDDLTMQEPSVISRLNEYQHLTCVYGPYKNNVQLLNRDLDLVDFDMVFIAHDESEPLVDGFDRIIVDCMREHFPDYDGVINLGEGHTDVIANTMPIVGRTWFDRFSYVFYPNYTQQHHDCELAIVARMLHKEFLYELPLIKYKKTEEKKQKKNRIKDPMVERFERRGERGDEQNQHNESIVDYELFQKRQQSLFAIDESAVCAAAHKIWSILICTIYDRQPLFEHIYTKLRNQISEQELDDRIEILYFLDERGEHTIGYKRNWLLQHSNGYYVNFIDDDDDVHDEYIKMIYEKLEENPDLVRVVGEMTYINGKLRKFVHTMGCKRQSKKDNTDYRIPIHLNTMKRHLALQCTFPEINCGEDYAWAGKLLKLDLYKTEGIIDTPYYFYLPSYIHERKLRKNMQKPKTN